MNAAPNVVPTLTVSTANEPDMPSAESEEGGDGWDAARDASSYLKADG